MPHPAPLRPLLYNQSMPVLATYFSLNDAEVARSALESAGIEAWLENENTVGVYWLYANALGGVRLVVSDEDLETARTALSDLRRPVEPADLPASPQVPPAFADEPDVLRCPECGSTDTVPFLRPVFFLIAGAIFLGIGVAVGEMELFALTLLIILGILLITPSHRCRSCGERFTPARRRPAPAREQEPPDEPCPRCGSPETFTLRHHRLKAATMLLQPLVLFIMAIWPFLAKKQCSACGNRW